MIKKIECPHFKKVDIRGYFQYLVYDRAVEQLVARWAHNPKVAGSNPARAKVAE
jgi:hypothetical protein